MCLVPQLLDDPNAAKIFPKDAIARARKYIDAIGSTGAYTESQGAAIFRDEIAQVSQALMRLLQLLASSMPQTAIAL